MEPAVDRRADTFPPGMNDDGTGAPQWSPPLIGGMTTLPRNACQVLLMPQWSPPLIGGMTGVVLHEPRRVLRAAMEPAVDRRDDVAWGFVAGTVYLPRWSPPLIGGMDRHPRRSPPRSHWCRNGARRRSAG